MDLFMETSQLMLPFQYDPSIISNRQKNVQNHKNTTELVHVCINYTSPASCSITAQQTKNN